MSNRLSSSWKMVKPHVPLIKFRKSGLQDFGRGEVGAAAAFQPSGATMSDPVTKSPFAVIRKPTLEEWQLPANFYRPPFTEEEIDYINRGGPA